MARARRSVEAALARWVERGLLDGATAARLHDEAREQRSRETRRGARYLIAAVGAFVLLVAAVLFAERTWANLGPATQSAVLLIAGAAAYAVGATFELGRRWLPSALLLQVGGLAVLGVGTVYSRTAWPDGTLGGVAMGVLALVAPLAGILGTRRRTPLSWGVHTAALFPLVAIFLSRALRVEFDDSLWVLDALGAVLVVGIALRLRSRAAAGPAERTDRLLAALLAALYAGLVLSLLTGTGPLEMENGAVYPADVWLALMAAAALWGRHRAPAPLRRAWYETQLALTAALAIPLLLFTTAEAMSALPEVTALVQVTLGALVLWYGLRSEAHGMLIAGAAALAAGAWIYGNERAEALGAIGALVLTAVLLFWVSTRIRAGTDDEGGA